MGESFSHRFKKSGVFEIQCANYLEIKGCIEVFDMDDEVLNTSKSIMSQHLEETPSKKRYAEETFTEMGGTSPLITINDFEVAGIKELILELSRQSTSEKKQKQFLSDGDIDEQTWRFSDNSSKKQTQKELKRKSRESSIRSEKENNHPDSLKSECKELNSHNTEKTIDITMNPKTVFGNRSKAFQFPVLLSLKNPRDEEQKFHLASSHSQECLEQLNTGKEENRSSISEDIFQYLRNELQGQMQMFKKNLNKNKNNQKRNRGMSKSEQQEREKIANLKDFLSNSKQLHLKKTN